MTKITWKKAVVSIVSLLVILVMYKTAVFNGVSSINDIFINKDVETDVAAILTILLPTKIELSKSLDFSISDPTNFAPFTPSSSIYLILILLRDIKDVSDAEKNPEPSSKTTNNPICNIFSVEPNLYHSPNFLNFILVLIIA